MLAALLEEFGCDARGGTEGDEQGLRIGCVTPAGMALKVLLPTEYSLRVLKVK